MTPKSLLRNPASVSSLDDLAGGRFERVIPDRGGARPEDVRRVLLASGKLYFELAAAREERKRADVALVRIEELYPFPLAGIEEAIAPYRDGTPAIWVQEEPENMGAGRFLRVTAGEKLAGRLRLSIVSREASGSPATGSASSHRLEQKELIARAFGGA
jgi:2-oxoglutarate dehydrogenase E1 component